MSFPNHIKIVKPGVKARVSSEVKIVRIGSAHLHGAQFHEQISLSLLWAVRYWKSPTSHTSQISSLVDPFMP